MSQSSSRAQFKTNHAFQFDFYCAYAILPPMGMGVTVYGFIDAPFIDADDLRKYHRNRSVEAIPADDRSRCILRGMFNMPDLNPVDGYANTPNYDAAPFAFAANYKEMPRLPAIWIEEFETILRGLYWWQALAVNDFSGIHYSWQMHPGRLHDPDKPGGFKLKCSAGNLQELPYDVAIEGDYPPKA